MHDWRGYVRKHLPPLAVGPQRENAIVAELALQLEQAYGDALAGGSSEPEASRLAQCQFGDWDALAREINRSELPAVPGVARPAGGVFAGAARDARFAARFLVRNPAFAAIAVATLAFGIGGNTAVFTMVDAVALRSLPYRQADRLMAIETRKAQQPELEPWTSALDFFDIRAQTTTFSAVAAISPIWSVVMTGRGEAERLESLYVSANLFPMLGVNAELGRTFLPKEDNHTQASNVVVLSHSLWQRRFGADRNVLGTSVNLDSGTYTVIGVLPSNFRYAGEPVAGTASEIDAWLPLSANPIVGSPRLLRFLKVAGRMKPGVSLQQSQDEIRRIGVRLAEQYPASNRGFAYDVQPLSAQVTGRFRVAMLLLLGTVGFVLLMACANVANLLLARASARQREISIRAALGASRFRLLRQLLTEGVVLAVAGGAAGLVVAYIGLRFLIRTAPATLLRPGEVVLDGRALLFTSAAVLACALLAGLPPAWRIVRADIESTLRGSGRGMMAGNHRLRSALVVVQVSVALVLMVGAGLLIRSFQRLLDVDPGFRPDNLITISTQMPQSAQTPAQRTALFRTMQEELTKIPGVQSVGVVSRLPLLGSNLGAWLFVEGKYLPGEPGYDVEYRVASPNYFAAMGIPLRAGRLFDEHDDANPAAGIVINQTAAHKFWPSEDPIGKRVKLGTPPERFPWITVLGVVGDVRHVGLDTDPRPEVYRPYAVNPLGTPILVIRTAADSRPLIGLMSAKVRSVSAGVPAYNVYAMQALVDRSTAQRRFVMLLLTGFAVAALLLAGVGVYGTVSQSVVQRTQEIGLRMALGASPAAASWLVFQQGILLTGAGIAAGSLAAVGLTRLMRKMLFEVRPLDPVSFLAAAIALGAFAALACYLPARRATRVDPLVALRQDC
ncbi:MAG TPA: ABC transporter permease [Bryobacteraceae bacterium]|jgi:putative ABC transport system permease protein|nr:ABC transporter permease [Bryobacteraceae bacterium]